MTYLNHRRSRRATFGGELSSPSAIVTDIIKENETKLSPLSNDTDPRVKKLKKALEGLAINPKPQRYIKLFTK